MIGRKQDFNISLSEYSGEVCLVLYHSPCFLNCNWCFNKNNLTNALLKYENTVRIISENREFITGVCLSGGEPLLSSDFYRICDYVRDENLKLKVNTSGVVPPRDEFTADYINLSFKGCFKDYQRYGYNGSYQQLKDNITKYSDATDSDKVEWSVVYHHLIVDSDKTLSFTQSIDAKPNYSTLNQLQVGECIDDFINDFTPPTRDELVSRARMFKGLATEHLLVETKEYGREIIL